EGPGGSGSGGSSEGTLEGPSCICSAGSANDIDAGSGAHVEEFSREVRRKRNGRRGIRKFRVDPARIIGGRDKARCQLQAIPVHIPSGESVGRVASPDPEQARGLLSGRPPRREPPA